MRSLPEWIRLIVFTDKMETDQLGSCFVLKDVCSEASRDISDENAGMKSM
jgi:hypothetical protein